MNKAFNNKWHIVTVMLITTVTLAIGVLLWHSGSQRINIGEECDGWCRGAEEPVVIIDVFPDFGCSICVSKERTILQVLELYPDDVRLDYHHYPYNDFSYTLAEALECAGEQGKFWEMHDKLYLEDMPGNISQILAAAESIGLDMKLFTESLESRKFKDKVLSEKEQAIAEGAQAASVYIDGHIYTGDAGSIDDFCTAIDTALEDALSEAGDR